MALKKPFTEKNIKLFPAAGEEFFTKKYPLKVFLRYRWYKIIKEGKPNMTSGNVRARAL